MGDNEERTEQPVGEGTNDGEQPKPAPQGGGQEGAAPKTETSQPGAASVAGEPTTGPETVQIPGLPEGMTLEKYVAQEVKRAQESTRSEYEGEGGHMARLKSSLQKQINELRRTQGADSQRAVEAALRMAEENPQQAIQMLTGAIQTYQQRDKESVYAAEMAEWVEGVAGGLDLDVNDAEVLKILEEVGPLTQYGASEQVLGRLTTLSNERYKKEAKDAQAALKKFEEDLPSLVRQHVATAMVESGAKRVDASESGAPPKKEGEEDLSALPASQLMRRGIAKGRERVPIGGNKTGG